MDNKETIKYFDLVVSYIDKPHQFWVFNILHDHILKDDPNFSDKVYDIENPVTSFGVDHGYFDEKILTNGNQLGSLTPKGRKLKDFGEGHEAFEKCLEEKNKSQINIENFIGRDNYGIQSSNSDIKNIKPKTVKQTPTKKSDPKSTKKYWYSSLKFWFGLLAAAILGAIFSANRIMTIINRWIDSF